MQDFSNIKGEIIMKHREKKDHHQDIWVPEELVERVEKWKS